MKPLIAVSPETVRQITQHYGDIAALISAAMECLAARFRKKGAALNVIDANTGELMREGKAR